MEAVKSWTPNQWWQKQLCKLPRKGREKWKSKQFQEQEMVEIPLM